MYSEVRSSAASHAPSEIMHSAAVARSSIHARTFAPAPIPPSAASPPTRTPESVRSDSGIPLVVASESSCTPAALGSTRKIVSRPSSSAGTSTRSAISAAGTQIFLPVMRKPSPSRTAWLGASSTSAAVAIRSPVASLGSPLRLLCRAAELGERQRREHDRLEERDRRGAPADLLEDRRDLEEAETRAAVRFGDRDAEQARVGHGAPQLAVEAQSAALLEHALILVAALVGEDLAREVADRLLIFGE
jgi:hypothetical protein